MKCRYINEQDLDVISIGSIVLGSGGGGHPEYECIRAKECIAKNGPIPLVDVNDIADDALIMPVGYMGAPLVSVEKLTSGMEMTAVLTEFEKVYGRRPSYVVAAEIGGSNAFAPLCAASQYGIPALDADTIGRAFPQLEMSACSLFGISPSPAFIADSIGRSGILRLPKARDVEAFFRALCTLMGSVAFASLYIMNGKEAKQALIKGSYTRAQKLGQLFLDGKLQENAEICFVASGVISDVAHTIQDGFLRGSFTVTGASSYTISYQNEYLIVYEDTTPIIMTPDIIAVVDAETGLPLSIEQISFGLSVHIVAIDSPPIWKTEAGLALVGPEKFGVKI